MKVASLFRDLFFLASLSVVTSFNLNVTAVTGYNGRSRFECWQLSTPFFKSTEEGIVGTASTFLGNVTNVTYQAFPAGFDTGFHRAPFNHWGVLLSGIVTIVLPDDNTTSLTTSGGEVSVVFLSDTAEVSKPGHSIYFPGNSESLLLQIPTVEGAIPEHKVLYDNYPCPPQQYYGLKRLTDGGSLVKGIHG